MHCRGCVGVGDGADMLLVDKAGGDVAIFIPERVQGGGPVVGATDTREFG